MQLDGWFGYRPVSVGQDVVVTASLGEGANVVILEGNPEADNGNQRRMGFEDAVAEGGLFGRARGHHLETGGQGRLKAHNLRLAGAGDRDRDDRNGQGSRS